MHSLKKEITEIDIFSHKQIFIFVFDLMHCLVINPFREFQARVAKQTVLGTNEQVEQPSVQASQQRLALGVLKGKSKTGAVPVDRAGTSHSGH